VKNIQDYTAEVEVAHKKAREAHAWLEFVQNNPDVVPCEANWLAALSYFNGEEITLKALSESFQSPDFRARLALQTPPTPANERENLLAEYQQAISGWSKEATQGELSKARYWTADQIKQKLTEVQTRKALKEKSVPELRLIANARPAPEPATIPAEFTRQRLLELKGPEFRRIIDRYGSKAVSERLNQR
jgi:hypothetical protein